MNDTDQTVSLDELDTGVPENAGGFPLNRIISFAGPYIALASGAVADWLLVHVHFLGLFHVTHNTVASAITQVVVFAVTAILTYAYHHKWLTGWQNWESRVVAPHYAPLDQPLPTDGQLPVESQPHPDDANALVQPQVNPEYLPEGVPKWSGE